MNQRKMALEHIKAAAAQGDRAKATRLYIENRISMPAYQQAWAEGEAMAKGLKEGKLGHEWHPYGNPNAQGSPGQKSEHRAAVLRSMEDAAARFKART